ncbi:hypothetical protein TRAPUB_9720 [Trametes pubescens]|uniref:Uncharacterized protein n=1 Tax=Trametes pubescens TaxID=154538 RepID=A0A1M2W1S4_TRAPU|nr:hypothetical protein TRAPUB_9720 [Trametes pubescens]
MEISERAETLPVRGSVATPDLVFPSIRPSLSPPRSPPAPPILDRAQANAEIVAPSPIRLSETVKRLEQTACEGTNSSIRKGKKRARLATPSPPLSPTPTRVHPGAIHRAPQTLRQRLVQTHRPYALAPPQWTAPTRTYRHLAPATAAMIAAALLPDELRVACAGLPPVNSSQGQATQALGDECAPPQLIPGLSEQQRATNAAPLSASPDLMFPMDLDLGTGSAQTTASSPFPYGLTPRVTNNARASRGGPLGAIHENGSDVAASPTLVPSTGFGSEASTLVNTPWPWATNENARPPLNESDAIPEPRHAPPATPTAARFQSQSAADLAARFIPPSMASNPLGPSAQANAQGTAVGTATYLAAVNAMHQGLGGGHSFTNAPEGGFPEVLFAEPDGLFAGLPRERVSAICSGDVGPCFLIHVHNSGFPSQHEIRALTLAIEGVIRQVTGELNPLVVPPEREWAPGADRRINPFAWAGVVNSQHSVDLMLDHPVWSSTAVTLHVDRPLIRISRFLFVLGGFAHDRNHSILNAVWAVFTGDAVLPSILRLVQTNPEFANSTPEEAARAVLASLEVRVSTLHNGNVIAAVFCDPPTLSIPRWREWRGNIAALPFPSPLNSTGFVRRPTPCAGCHGCDHPTHLCPFQDVPGWNAPPPGTTWGPPTAGQFQGQPGGPPPPPPPPGGGALARTRLQGPRRPNSSNAPPAPRRDFRGGGDGKAGGSGSGRGGFGGAPA